MVRKLLIRSGRERKLQLIENGRKEGVTLENRTGLLNLLCVYSHSHTNILSLFAPRNSPDFFEPLSHVVCPQNRLNQTRPVASDLHLPMDSNSDSDDDSAHSSSSMQEESFYVDRTPSFSGALSLPTVFKR